MTSWIIGNLAADKISYLADAFFESRRICAGKIFSRNFETYLPWMSSNSLAMNFANLAVSGYRSEHMFQTDPTLLKVYSKTLLRSKDFDLFSEKKDSLAIFENIAEIMPDSENCFSLAWELLQNNCEWIARLGKKLVKEVIPVRILNGQIVGAGGATNHHLIGTLFLSRRSDPYETMKLAISFAHEIGHTALMIVQQGDSISCEPPGLEVYSAVRKCKRPLIMAVHAAVASGYMIECARSLLANPYLRADELNFAKERIADYIFHLEASLNDLKNYRFTEIGIRIINDLDQLVQSEKKKVPFTGFIID